jgi:F0F1-type ATP synthase assembly protein I
VFATFRKRYPRSLMMRLVLAGLLVAAGIVIVNLLLLPLWLASGIGSWVGENVASISSAGAGGYARFAMLNLPTYFTGIMLGALIGWLRCRENYLVDLMLFALLWAAGPWLIWLLSGPIAGLAQGSAGVPWMMIIMDCIGVALTFGAGIMAARHFRARYDTTGRCVKCGYSTYMLPTSICPECGSDLSKQEVC